MLRPKVDESIARSGCSQRQAISRSMIAPLAMRPTVGTLHPGSPLLDTGRETAARLLLTAIAVKYPSDLGIRKTGLGGQQSRRGTDFLTHGREAGTDATPLPQTLRSRRNSHSKQDC